MRMTRMIVLNRGESVSNRRGGYAPRENNYHLFMYFMLL